MNKDILKGDWKIAKGKIKEQWGKLTDDELSEIRGQRDQLLGLIQKKYGISKDTAEKQISEWERSCSEACEREHATSKSRK